MSRSSHFYYNLCGSERFPIEDDGFCYLHRPFGGWMPNRVPCFGPGQFSTRRGVFVRKRRFPEWSWKSWCSGPPRAVKRAWRRQERAKYKQELLRDGDITFNGWRWLAGMYGWWS